MKTMRICLALSCVCLAASAAWGSILSVDFNGRTGTSTGTTYLGNGVLRADGSSNPNPGVGTATGPWDGISFATPNAPSQSFGFLDSNSVATSVTLAFTGENFQDNCQFCSYAGGNPANQSLLNDYIGVANGTSTMTIGGLAPSTSYDLYIYGTNGGSGEGGTWSVNGSATQTTGFNSFGSFSQYQYAKDYVKFTVASDLLGRLVVTGTPGPLSNAYALIDGFQLTNPPAAVPEPGSLVLLGLGAVGLLVFARRRKSGGVTA